MALDLDKILIINNKSRNSVRVRTYVAVNKDAVKKKFSREIKQKRDILLVKQPHKNLFLISRVVSRKISTSRGDVWFVIKYF